MTATQSAEPAPRSSLSEVFIVFLRLGLTSFGGPVAHIGYFRDEFVGRRKWLGEAAYADLVALCQFLPGPASSQVGIAVGLARGGLAGALAAWLGFTAPSAIAMTLFGLGVVAFADAAMLDALRGLKIVAVAVVAQAVWAMARSLCPDAPRATVAVAAAVFLLAFPVPWGQLWVIAAGAVIGVALLRADGADGTEHLGVPVGRGFAVTCLVLFFVLLVGLPLWAAADPQQAIKLFDSFYRSGSLVFGGGHVVLPLLQGEVVPPGWVSNDAFLAGYGAAQAVPGPLFTFAAFLGAVSAPAPNGIAGAAIALAAIFLPSFLLIVGTLPFWDALRRLGAVRKALVGVNAAVVGLLLAALYDPVITSAIGGPADAAFALAAFLALAVWRLPPWLVVIAAAAAGVGLGYAA